MIWKRRKKKASRHAGALPEPGDRCLMFWVGEFHVLQEISSIEGGQANNGGLLYVCPRQDEEQNALLIGDNAHGFA
jgi:hypothetical protein